VFTRHLALKLLAPTVLVSLLLVMACASGALYLSHLHVDISGVLSEHIDSTLAAWNLQTAVAELLKSLRGSHDDPTAATKQLIELNRAVHDRLQKARDLANLDREQVLTGEITAALDEYQGKWEERGRVAPGQQVAFDARLAKLLENRRVLEECKELRDFNTDQVGAADRANRDIMTSLTWGLLVVAFAAPLSGLILGYAVARSIHQSIYQLSVRIRDAAGRLSSERPPLVLEEPSDLPDLHRQMQGVVDEIERVVERLQQREREASRAEQLAAVGQVAAGVAHELRNPLTSVKMLVQTGLEGPKPAGLPTDDLIIIEHEVRRMEACIQTFLDFARPPHCERQRTGLLTVVRRALALVEGRARRQKVKCLAELPAGPVELNIDGNQIQQVLVNLLLNALDALPQGGTIRLEVRTPANESNAVVVQVQDDGSGLSPEVQKRLFEPFVSTRETGLGLGLSICRRLVEAHGGAIHGANAPEGGALFAFTLPAS
jgi:two-component system, NtrC family, sensor histidine kinase HydH